MMYDNAPEAYEEIILFQIELQTEKKKLKDYIVATIGALKFNVLVL